jgi:conjugative relaxase-like TrwC/TraI family protein
MISLAKLDSASGAVKYYLKVVEYYGDGQWLGEGAKAFNIHGHIVQPDLMLSLLEGKLPNGQQLGFKSGNKETGEIEIAHRPGYDITFSAPKMVSILIETKSDPELEEAFKETVHWLVKKIEDEFAEAMKRESGQKIFEKTANLIIAGFQHPDSRMGDPESHFHMVVMNATKCADGKYRSLSSDLTKENGFYDQLWKQRNYLGLQARNYLLNKVKELGKYEITNVGDGLWDIALPNNSLYQKVTKHFSKQSEKIKEYMDDKGWISAKAKALANARTRDPKAAITDLNGWREDIRSQCKIMGFDPNLFVKSQQEHSQKFFPKLKQRLIEKFFTKDEQKLMAGRDSIEFAVSVLSQREAVFTEKDLKTEALKYAINNEAQISNEQIDEAITKSLADESLYQAEVDESGSRRFTTPWQLTIESETQARIKNGLNSCQAICNEAEVAQELKALYREKRFTPTDTQREAINALLTSKDRYIAIQGFAGTGKTKMVSVIADIAERHGVTLLGASSSSTATEELEKKGGIQSDVLIKKLTELENNHQALENTLLILDESSMVSSQHFHLITKLVEQRGGRLCYLGDKEQCPSPSAGKDFELTQSYGQKTVYVTDFIRFKDEDLKKSASSLVKHDLAEAFSKISHIEELDTHEERINYMAKTWLSYDQKKRDETYLLALSHKDREKITDIIREELVKEGTLCQDEMKTTRYVRCNTAERKLREVKYYQENQVLLFNKAVTAHRVEPGEYFTVGEITNAHKKSGSLPLIRENGRKITFKLKNLPKFKQERSEIDRPIELYEKKEISLRTGDTVMWKKNNTSIDVKNGEVCQISAIKDDKVTLQNNKYTVTVNISDKSLRHIDHGYVLTINASQGKDKTNVIFPHVSHNQYGTTFANTYVPITRAMKNVTMVTDNTENLLKQIELSSGHEKTSALDLVSSETLKRHQERFRGHKQALDISSVVSKKEEIDEGKIKQRAHIEAYRLAKESGNHLKAYKLAHAIALEDNEVILARKKLSYSSHELHKDALKFQTAKLKSALNGEDLLRFLRVKSYVLETEKLHKQVKQIKGSQYSGNSQDLNKKKLYSITNKRNQLAHAIASDLESHKPYLEHFSIGKANKIGYLAYEHYSQQDKALGRLEGLGRQAQKHQINQNIASYLNAEKDKKGALALLIKRDSKGSHPHIINHANALGLSGAELWKQINLDARSQSNSIFREKLNPNERILFDKISEYKSLNRQIGQSLKSSEKKAFVIDDKLSGLIDKRNRIASTIDTSSPNQVTEFFKVDLEKIANHSNKIGLIENVKAYKTKANFSQKKKLAVDIIDNIKAYYPSLKAENIDIKGLSKLATVVKRQAFLNSLEEQEKQRYQEIIKYKQLCRKSAKLWHKIFNPSDSISQPNVIQSSRYQSLTASKVSAKRNALAFKINRPEYQFALDKEGVKLDRLKAFTAKHQVSLMQSRAINDEIKLLADAFYKGDLASNKHQLKHWLKSWSNLQIKANQFKNSPTYLACESSLKIDSQRIDFINQTIKKMGVFHHDKTDKIYKSGNIIDNNRSLANGGCQSRQTQNNHYDLTLINDITKSNPKDIYTQIFGEPTKSSPSELRYRGGLIVTLTGAKKGLWYDFSEGLGGGIIQAIQHERGVGFKEAIAIAADIAGVDKSANNTQQPRRKEVNTSQSIEDFNEIKYKKESTKSAISIWNGCIDIKGTLAEKYLVKHRKIIETGNLNIKFWPVGAKWMNVSKDGKVEYKINKTPALVVAAINHNGELKAVQRTYLDPKTAGKNAFFDNPKLAKGSTKSNFCKLQNGSRGADLYLAEGVETGASIAQLKPNDHVLVSFGQDNMKNLTDIINNISPRSVYIASDNDGLKSPSKSLIQTIYSLQSKGIKADVLMPDMLPNNTKTDWNDVLKTKGKTRFYLEVEGKLNAQYSNIDHLKDDIIIARSAQQKGTFSPDNDYNNDLRNHHSQTFTKELVDREMEV